MKDEPIQILTNVLVRKMVRTRENIHLNGVTLIAPVGWEGQSQAHKNQQEICIGTVEKVGEKTADLKPGDVVVIPYTNGWDIEVSPNVFLYPKGQILAKLEDGKLTGVQGYKVGFAITNGQAVEVGLIAKSPLALDSWENETYMDKHKYHYFLSERKLHMIKTGYIGRQVLDVEDFGLDVSGLPRTMFFVDGESEIPVEIGGEYDFQQPGSNRYNPLELISTEDVKR